MSPLDIPFFRQNAPDQGNESLTSLVKSQCGVSNIMA